MSFFAVIMAGGSGERFWPASRHSKPKQLLSLFDEKTLIEHTVERQLGLCPAENIIVITSERLVETLQNLLPIPSENIIGEPCRRDTAPAVGLAAALVRKRGGNDAVMAMLPADQIIHDEEKYSATMKSLIEVAEKEDQLITLGIKPTDPATGFGYIHRGSNFKNYENVYDCLGFQEKPNVELAEKLLKSEQYFWNAGIFVWSVKTIFKALKKSAPQIAKISTKLSESSNFTADLEELFPNMPRISVDYAIMEKAQNIIVVPADFDWDDAGSWPALQNHLKADDDGNVSQNAEIVTVDSNNNIIYSEVNGHTIAMVGIKDMIAVHTADATLICPIDRAQEIKTIVQKLNERGSKKL